jgi:hypothetical protein
MKNVPRRMTLRMNWRAWVKPDADGGWFLLGKLAGYATAERAKAECKDYLAILPEMAATALFRITTADEDNVVYHESRAPHRFRLRWNWAPRGKAVRLVDTDVFPVARKGVPIPDCSGTRH